MSLEHNGARVAAQERDRKFAVGLARAFAGSIVFTLPLLMTMEMWSLGFSMQPLRLAWLLVAMFPMLVALSWHAGFEPTFNWRDDVVDALVAVAVGFAASGLLMLLLALIDRTMSAREILGKVALQAVPGAIGALLAQSQLGQREMARDEHGGRDRYASELFAMGIGGVFLAFNLAPTQEMILISFRLHEWQVLLLVLVTLALMHAFVYSVSFRGAPADGGHTPGWSLFARFTAVGYVLALLLSAFMLWTFGRLDGLGPSHAFQAAAVLAFPAGIGAAAARLIL